MKFTALNKLNDNDSLRESWEDKSLISEWKLINSKSVPDSDGFMTEYAWYTNGDKHIFMFGDMDIYGPDEDYADWVCETESEAQEWFDNYHGFDEEEDEDTTYPLTEAYDNLPDWVTIYLNKNKWLKDYLTNKKNINLKTAIFEEALPGNLTKSMLDDYGKLWILDLRIPSWSGSTTPHIYIPRVDNTDDIIYINNRQRKISNLGTNKLIDMIARCGYIDLDDSSNRTTAIRNERRSKVPQRDLTKQLHPVKRNIQYGLKPDGSRDYDNILSYDIEWVTHKGYDKNGYKLDPDKYIRLLNEVGCDNCGQRLDRMFDQLESIRTRLLNVLSGLNIKTAHKYRTSGFHNNLFDDTGNALRSFSDVVSKYTRLKERVDHLLSKDPRPENIDERIKNVFEWDARDLSKDIRELMDTCKKLENPIPIPEYTED